MKMRLGCLNRWVVLPNSIDRKETSGGGGNWVNAIINVEAECITVYLSICLSVYLQ